MLFFADASLMIVAPEQVPAGAYTHLNYAFAFVDPSSYQIAPMSELDISLYPRFTGIKENNPGLQTWIAIGGWSMNDPGKFSQLYSLWQAMLKISRSTHRCDILKSSWFNQRTVSLLFIAYLIHANIRF